MRDDNVCKGILVPGLPHPLLCPEKNQGWQRVRDAYEKARAELEESGAEILVLYSTCLLYTSPSPRDVEESRMPSSA